MASEPNAEDTISLITSPEGYYEYEAAHGTVPVSYTHLRRLLFAGSGPPPSFTATASSLPIFVKIFPFAASFFSFLCLIFANLECPDISFLNLLFYLRILLPDLSYPVLYANCRKQQQNLTHALQF